MDNTKMTETQLALENAKSYTMKAVVTLLLYFLLFIPGFIANIVFLGEANKTKKIIGRNPEGHGCLLTMFIIATVFVGFYFMFLYSAGF
jgi:TRAP-type mannitol/chloroaromatic compound transport system permease small subunit